MDTKVALPDIDEMFDILDEIHNLGIEKARLDFEIKVAEANINKIVSTDSQFFLNGKPPSQAYIDNTYKFCGINNELIDKRKRLFEIDVEIEFNQARFNLLRTVIEIWRTQSANERVSI